MTKYQITPKRKAHLYALMAWNDQYTKEQAEKIAFTTEYDQLNGITWAEDSITTGYNGILEKITNGTLVIPAKRITSEWDAIIEILAEIHDKWVKDNAKKYNRGSEEKSNKNLFQHLPTALIGIDELSKDLMFLAPFLESIGLNAGEMNLVPYGSFKPSQALINAYNRYVEKYKKKYGIESLEDLSLHIDNCLNGDYFALRPVDEISKNRIDYMKNSIDILVSSVSKRNEMAFGSLPTSSNEQH